MENNLNPITTAVKTLYDLILENGNLIDSGTEYSYGTKITVKKVIIANNIFILSSYRENNKEEVIGVFVTLKDQ